MGGKWTKGIWRVGPPHVIRSESRIDAAGDPLDGGRLTIFVAECYGGAAAAEQEANARLIAQAPAMAVALEAFVAACETAPPVDLIAHIGAACERAKALLTAIKGE